MADRCEHLGVLTSVSPRADGCEECMAAGGGWVHLRMCMTCGHIGCCDSSPNTHATKHFHETSHPVMQSYEPGESWWWCYIDNISFAVAGAASYSHG